MFSTLRNRLAIALGAMLVIVLGLALLLYWETRRTQTYLQRGHYTHAQLEAYLHLSLEAQRYFKHLADRLALGPALKRHDIGIESPSSLHRALDDLKKLTETEVQSLDNERDRTIEREEIERIEQLEILIQRINQISREVVARPNDGLQPRTWQVLTQTLEQIINEDFRRLIDAALADERAEVRQVERHGEDLRRRLVTMATMVAIAAIGLAVVFGTVLFRSIKQPLDNLVTGTAKLAGGELGYRLTVAGPAELRQLAERFNTMSAGLERQQQHLLEARAQLEQKVAERTHELHDANRELQRLDQTRRQFFADISHELRTPLTIIRGEAEVTLRGGDKTVMEYQTTLQRIVDLSDQLGRLVDDLLLLARSDSISTRTEVKTLSLDQLLQQVCTHARALAHKHGQSISLGLSDHGLQVRGDPQRLYQLLMIFIDNACRYSQSEGVIVLSLEKDGNDAVIAVSDNGIGIAADELVHVFERRYRGENARTLAPTGSGLGLPLARSIVRAHHGSIDLSSTTNGGGTMVTIRLPLLESLEDKAA
jgi:signal transduction histidine kinase